LTSNALVQPGFVLLTEPVKITLLSIQGCHIRH
jgi:hypothetical protein